MLFRVNRLSSRLTKRMGVRVFFKIDSNPIFFFDFSSFAKAFENLYLFVITRKRERERESYYLVPLV